MKILQEKRILEIRFVPQPRILDSKGRIAQECAGDIFQKWEINSGSVLLINSDDRTLKAKISFKDLSVIADTPETKDSFKEASLQFIEKVWTRIPSREILRIGVRSLLYLIPESDSDISIESFKKHFHSNIDINKLVGGEIQDIGFAYDSVMENEYQNHVAFGPSKESQIKELFNSLEDYKEGIFLDYDFYKTGWHNKMKTNDVKNFLKEALTSTDKLVKSLVEELEND
ncbi:MAG: hypothetical protein AB9915_01760 [Candidatus Dojkabacteria bacterium]